MVKASFVVTDRGRYLVQIEDADRWPRHGFALCDDDQAWEGGLGVATSWKVVSESEVPEPIRQELQYVIEAACE
jgi:hypothetical protein